MGQIFISVPALVSLLLRRKRLIFLSGVLTSAIAVGISHMLPLTFTSEGQVVVEAATMAEGTPSPTMISDVATQVDVLQSDGLIRKAVRDANLLRIPDVIAKPRLPGVVLESLATTRAALARLMHAISGSSPRRQQPEAALIKRIQEHLAVKAREHSNIISVRFSAGSPEAAAAVVNGIIRAYLDTLVSGQDARIAKVNRWTSQEISRLRDAVVTAERRVAQYAKTHNLSEVQQSLTAAIQLSNDQNRLTAAREELTRQKSLLDTISHGGDVAGTQESLGLRTVQDLRGTEAGIVQRLSVLGPTDPRRGPLEKRLASIRRLIGQQNRLVVNSLSRLVLVAEKRVASLEQAVRQQAEQSRVSSVEGTEFKQLTSDLSSKREALIQFTAQAARVRLAAEESPTARLLFPGVPPYRGNSFGLLALVAGFFAGSIGAAGVVVSGASLSEKVKSGDDVRIGAGIPVIGTLPRLRQTANVLAAPPSPALVTETFRALWLRLRQEQKHGRGVMVLVTSSDVREGKTTVAVALAHQLADDGFKVLLVDADLRRPRLSARMSCPAYLESVLSGEASFEDATIRLRPGLQCLLTNGRTTNPLKTLQSEEFERLFTTAQWQYDFILFDSPPALQVADPIVLARLAQYIVFVIQAGRLPCGAVADAVQRFRPEDHAKISGLLTNVHWSRLTNRYYYGGYDSKKSVA